MTPHIISRCMFFFRYHMCLEGGKDKREGRGKEEGILLIFFLLEIYDPVAAMKVSTCGGLHNFSSFSSTGWCCVWVFI